MPKVLNHEQPLLMASTNGGASFTGSAAVPLTAGDRPYYTAPAISPNRSDVYITYNAFTTPYRNDTSSPQGVIGAIIYADVTGGKVGLFGTLARGVVGDPRASSQDDLTADLSVTKCTRPPPARTARCWRLDGRPELARRGAGVSSSRCTQQTTERQEQQS